MKHDRVIMGPSVEEGKTPWGLDAHHDDTMMQCSRKAVDESVIKCCERMSASNSFKTENVRCCICTQLHTCAIIVYSTQLQAISGVSDVIDNCMRRNGTVFDLLLYIQNRSRLADATNAYG